MDAWSTVNILVKRAATEPEVYVRDNLVTYQDGRPYFSDEKFCAVLDTIDEQKLCDIILYLDSVGVTVHHVYTEMGMDSEDFEEGHGRFYASQVGDECIMTFDHFIRMGYGGLLGDVY